MDELDGHRSFAYARGYSFHRTMPDISHSKDARHIGFQEEWIAIERPLFRVLAVLGQFRSGKNESPFIALDLSAQPIGPRQGPNENKHGSRVDALHFVGVGAEHGNFFKVRGAMHFGHAGMRP